MDKGQTLVEMAVVLPCFCLGIFMGVQLIVYCHNMIELQRMAQVMADRPRDDFRVSLKEYPRFHALWGTWTDNNIRITPRRAQPWRAHKGISTVREPGAFMQVRVGARLIPGTGFSRMLGSAQQLAFSETYAEPRVPREE